MKKWIVTAAVIIALLAVMLLPWAMMQVSGHTVALLDCLPQEDWLEFEGGCGNPTNPGNGMNLDDFRDRCNVPDEIPYTTAENVRAALDGVTVRTGQARDPKGDFFQYDFLLEPEEEWRLCIYENGCIKVTVDSTVINENHEVVRGSYNKYFYHDSGAAYKALDQRFLNLHEERALMGIPD